jgi:dolichol-phosphate mannosyltransferase
VPIYKEAEHVEQLLQAIEASPVRKEIIVVDDGSTDGTREKLGASPAAGVTVIFHETNCGRGAAVRTGLQYARGDYVLIQDSDLEYDPQDYAALLRPLQEGKANVVYGVRPDRPERGLRFYLGAKFLTYLTNLLYGAGIHDEATCYKVFRRFPDTEYSPGVPGLRILSGSDRQTVTDGRENLGSPRLLCAT